MDHAEEDSWSYGKFPEFGAIFMSNIQTKKECLRRKIFALSSSHTEFVTRIKAGMVLFLFEFKTRQLFGVYQASSDGAVDIIPHAFNYSGKRFPAQVRFRQLWHCNPLSEKEFRDAIAENYFSANKFNFGLSKDQVRRLLYLFSSRKVKSKMHPLPRPEANFEVAVKDRRNFSERGYMAPAEYDEINRVASRDHHVNSLAGSKEDRVLVEDGSNAEGKVHCIPKDDFLAKRRRIGQEGWLTTNNAAENGRYSHGYRMTSCTDSPDNSLGGVRRLVNAGRLSTVQMVNENQVNEIYNPMQSSEHSLDPLDVRAREDYTFLQRSRLLDDCNMHNGSRQAFASDHYGNSVDQIKYSVNDDRFLSDDSVKTECNMNAAISMANSDYNLKVCREAREILEDREWLMNRELENEHHLDCDDSSVNAFNPSARLLHKIRKTTAAERFQIDENEPHFGICSVEGFSSENVLHPLQSGYRTFEGRKYPIVERISTENMIDKVPPILATNAGYTVNADRQTVHNGSFRKNERLDNQEVGHTHSNTVMSMKYPSFSQLGQSLSSVSNKLIPEKQLSQFTISGNFNLSRSAFDDATITRVVPYSPDHPSLSHGCTASIEANKGSTSMQRNLRHDGSLGNFNPLSSNRSQHYFLESEKSGRPLDTALELGNKRFASSTSGLRSSLESEKSSRPLGTELKFGNERFASSTSGPRSSLLQESTDPLVHPNSFSDMNLGTSAPVNYRGSLPSKLSPPRIGLKKFEDEKGLLAYYSKSSDHHFAFDGNLPEASRNQSKHVPQHGMVTLAGNKIRCSESSFQPETDLAAYDNQHLRFSSNKNLKEPNKVSESNSIFNRRSVFSRLSSKESFQFDEEMNDLDVNHQDSYMGATVDEVMQMLQQDNNPPLRKLRKSVVVGQPRESSVNEKKTQYLMETDHSTVEKRNLNNAIEDTADCMNEIPKETRILDFKRRSDRKKNLVLIGADSASHSKTTGANEEVKREMNSTFRRKRLVRPVFGKTDTAFDASHCSETLQIPAPILDNDDKQGCHTVAIMLHASEIPGSSNVLALHSRQEMDCNKEPLQPAEQKDVVAHVMPSSSFDLKGHKQAKDGLHIGSSNVMMETSQRKRHEQANDDDLHIGSSDIPKELSQQKRHEEANDDLHIGSSTSLQETSLRKGHEQSNDDDLRVGCSNVLQETTQQKGHEQASDDDLHSGSSDALKETSQQKRHEQANSGSSDVLKETSQQKRLDEANDDLHIGSSTALQETSLQKLHEQSKDDDLCVGSSNVLQETTQQKGHEQASDDVLHSGSSDVLKETSQQKGYEQANDDDLHICSSNVLQVTTQQKGHEQASDDDLHSGSSDVLKETSQQKGHEQANDDDLHICSSNVLQVTTQQKGHEQASDDDLHSGSSDVLKETSRQKGHEQPNNDDLHISSSNVLQVTTQQKGHEQANDDDLHIGSSNVLEEASRQKGREQANDDYLPIGSSSDVLKETSQQKSLDIQTSLGGILAKDTDATTTGLNLPESSLEGFKLGSGCGNILIEEKHLTKMKIILTTKTDVNASSQ